MSVEVKLALLSRPNLVKKTANEPKRDLETLAKLHLSERQGPEAHETASCYCGKARAELLFRLSEEEIREDNCSSCVRVCILSYRKQ